MKLFLLNLLCCSLSVSLSLADTAELEGFFSAYCYKCHDEETQKGDLRLDGYVVRANFAEDRKVWLSVLEQLETEEMPPKKPLPTGDEYLAVATLIEESVNSIDWETYRHPGHVTLPRLTKAEYNNSIRDLFGLDIQPGRSFTADGEGQTGFTNDRDNLFVSSSDLEKYLQSADLTLEALRSLKAKDVTIEREAEAMFMTESRSRVDKFPDGSEGFSLTSGQKTIYDSFEFPSHGFYRFTIRGRSTEDGPADALLRIDNALVGEIRLPGNAMSEASTTGFVSPGTHQIAMNVKLPPREKKKPGKKAPVFTSPPENAPDLVTKGAAENSPQYRIDADASDLVKAKVALFNRNQSNVQRAYEWLRLHGEKGDPREHRRFKKYVADRLEPIAQMRLDAAGALGITLEEFDRRFAEMNPKEFADRKRLDAIENTDAIPKLGFVGVDWLKIEGPITPGVELGPNVEAARAAAEAVFDGDAWEPWFESFVSRAFREPIGTNTFEKYFDFYESIRENGEDHESAATQTVSAVLVSPRFLFRSEELPGDVSGKTEALNDHQLASRLSYFLWQSIPDEALRAVADSGDLSDSKILNAEIDRMLNDPKAEAFFETFPAQWLGYEALGKSVVPDGVLFPEFDRDLSKAMKAEPQMLFGRVFRENRSLLDLVNARQTYLNARLAKHYGVPDVKGDTMQLVSLSDDVYDKRGGLLGMAGILTATSTPVRTSPVLRGVFVMERLLGDEPGEPPADAGELPGEAGKRGKTLREELEIHRDRADCAICHDKIDPLGFGLEGFDVLGRWRTNPKKPIDTSGELPDGSSFDGVSGLRDYIVQKRGDDFALEVVRKLLAYALGRELQYYDAPVIEQLNEEAAAAGYRGRAVVEAIVRSYPFQHQHPSPELEIQP